MIKDLRGRIIFKCYLCKTNNWKRKENNLKGFQFDLCNKHLRNPEAASKPEFIGGKISLIKEQ